MAHLPITLLAYFLNAIAVLIDKVMLTKHFQSPLIYVFYISAFSLVALLLLPFTFFPSLQVLILASMSTILWTGGAFFMFKSLKVGVATRVIPVIGTLIPLLLLVNALFSDSVNASQAIAVVALVLGLVFLTLPDWRGKILFHELIFEFVSAFLFALSYIFLREAYIRENFLSVLVYSRLVLIPILVTLLLLPRNREIILAQNQQSSGFKLFSKMGLLFLLGQASGGFSELLLTYSISLATPALVNSLQGAQYVFLLLFSLLLSRYYPQIFSEHWTKLSVLGKFGGILLIAFGLYILAFQSG